MKKILLPMFVAAFMFIAPGAASAKVMTQEKGTIVIAADEVINDDLFVAGESIAIDGTVNGDVFAAAGSVRISGKIKGGLFVGTGDLTLSGASVGGSLAAGSGNISLDKDTAIGGSLLLGAGTIKNNASIGRSIIAGAGTIYQNGKVGNEARLGAGTIELGSASAIAGDLTYALGEDEKSGLITSPTSSVSGTTSRFVAPERSREELNRAKASASKMGKGFKGFWAVYTFLSSLIIGSIFLKLFPNSMAKTSSLVLTSTMKSIGTGVLITVLSVPVLLAIALTVIGLPLAGLLLTVLIIDFHIARLIAVYALGQYLVRILSLGKLSPYLVFLFGLVIFSAVKMLPVFGFVTSSLFTTVGLGAIWAYMATHLKNL